MRPSPIARTTRTTLGAIAAGALLLAGASTASAGVRTPAADAPARASAAALAAYTASPADVRMRSALTSRATTARFGTVFSGTVLDAASNTTVWGRNSTSYRMPASTNKLVTATNALTVFGPGKRWTTRVRSGSSADRVILVGAGDPSLKSTGLEAMA
ncbi:MAG: D-alanyl-D-alanine carboxypeptidase, partial [Ornithinibacter sp.]